jgi:transcriptional antiterminator NusG
MTSADGRPGVHEWKAVMTDHVSEQEDQAPLPSAEAADGSGAASETAAVGRQAEGGASAAVPPAEPVADADAAAAPAEAEEAAEDDGPVELADPFEGDEDAKPVEEVVEEAEVAPAAGMEWFILKVQSNREDSIRETLLRRISMQGMNELFGEVIVPKEQVTDFKGGKKRVVSRKLYPGYILVQMVLNDETWFLVRETGGIGDFTGSAGKPSPMLPQDVAKLLHKEEEETAEAPRLKINFKKGDRVKINEGTFENFEGEVEQIDEANGRVTVMLSIFGRSTPVDIEYWQIESV